MTRGNLRSGGPPPPPPESSNRRKKNNKSVKRVVREQDLHDSTSDAVVESSIESGKGKEMADDTRNDMNDDKGDIDNDEEMGEGGDKENEDEVDDGQEMGEGLESEMEKEVEKDEDPNEDTNENSRDVIYSPDGLAMVTKIINGPVANPNEEDEEDEEGQSSIATSNATSVVPTNTLRRFAGIGKGGASRHAGRGKGGASRLAGRGKGGRFANKKPKKVGMQNLTKPVIRRLARRGGIHRISGLLYESVREFSMKFLRKIICDAIVFMKHQCRKTITLEDVRRAATHNNNTLLH
jgi:histone H4